MLRRAWRRVLRGTRQRPLIAGPTWAALALLVALWARLLVFVFDGHYAAVQESGVALLGSLAILFGAFPVLVLGLLSGIASLGEVRPFPLGRCQNCGYDLRGITDRCPECGKSIHWTEDQ